MPELDRTDIPNRSLFRQPEVCEIAHIQPYVLRSWEAEFPDLGTAKTTGGPRVYRRADVERVLRLKQLVYVDGLTLAGARRKLLEESPPPPAVEAEDEGGLSELLGSDARERIRHVHRVLKELSTMLAAPPGTVRQASADEPFELRVVEDAKKTRSAKPAARAALPARKKR